MNAVAVVVVVVVVVTDRNGARCILWYALNVGQTPQSHSSPVVIGLFTAAIALVNNDLHHSQAGKQKTDRRGHDLLCGQLFIVGQQQKTERLP